jgi:hypothetical protein
MKKLLTIVLSFFAISTTGIGQVVNGYAEVTNIAGSVLTVSSVDEGGDSFEDGQYLVIMQMQDNVIGTTTNTASFGDLGSILSAGLYEIRLISSHTESAGLPATITLSDPLTNTYNTGTNSKVQVITFPTFGSPDYTTVSNMSAKDWDGTTGGVLCFNVDGVLTLAHNLTASGAGFRGGANDINTTCGGGVCEDNVYISTRTTRGYKGEGIYRNTNTSYEAARGKILNGGGGGTCHNAGGGGGGNYTDGGEGGTGYGCRTLAPRRGGGLGGLALSGSISASRIFMGGGGGSGEINNSQAAAGGDGGGIILINADEIETTGACGGRTISVNGLTTPDIANDGAGGAGAGGSIVIQVNSWNISASCPITVAANGGDGGTAVTGTSHGGGGGGAQGVAIFSITAPTVNTTVETNNGNGGCNNSSSPCNDGAFPAAGTSGSGIIGGASGPLPVQLIAFTAENLNNTKVKVAWITASEINNAHFMIQRSADGENWQQLGKVKGAGNSNVQLDYSFIDEQPMHGVAYYQLIQTDFNGSTHNSGVVAATLYRPLVGMLVYPNPAKNRLFVEVEDAMSYTIYMLNALGQKLTLKAIPNQSGVEFNTSVLLPGIYYLRLTNGETEIHKKIIIQ